MGDLERLEKELDHLVKTHKAGIIDDSEFEEAKEKIEGKLVLARKESEKDDQTKKIITDILEGKEIEEEDVVEPEVEIKDTPEEPKKEPVKVQKDEPLKEQKKVSEEAPAKEPKEQKEEPKEEHKKEKAVKAKKEPKKDSPKQVKKKEPEKEVKKSKPSRKKKKQDNTPLYVITGIVALFIILALFLISGEDDVIVPKDMTNVTATVDIKVFTSYSCKPCYDTWQNVKDLKIMYGDKAQVTVVPFPLDLESDLLMDSAIQCSSDRTDEMIEAFFRMKKPATDAKVDAIAMELGLDTAEFKDCLEDKETILEVASGYKSAVNSGVDTLPTVIINTDSVLGNQKIGVYEIIIDSGLEII
jgi:protein-disulfide isomerase